MSLGISENMKIRSEVKYTEMEQPLLLATMSWEQGSKPGILVLTGTLPVAREVMHIQSIDIKCDLSNFNLSESRVIVGAARMGEKYRRFDVSQTPFAIHSESYLLFRLGHYRYLLVGFISWRTFCGTMSFADNVLNIFFAGDGKMLNTANPVKLEDFVFIECEHWQEALERYTEILSERHNIAHVRPALWRGWGSWDYYADNPGEKELLDNYNQLRLHELKCPLLQLDDGYCVWGDWLDLDKGKFPNDISDISAVINNDGGTTGLWMAPFLAHKKSKLYLEHPDWFLRNGEGNALTAMNLYYVLDYSLPEVCDWLKHILQHMYEQWGIRYFKLDFLWCGLMPCRSEIDGITPLERFHRCFETIKDTLKDNVYIVGCSAVFGPCLGYVDGMRTGPDVSPRFDDVKEAVHGSISQWFMHGKTFNCDPDYLLLRSHDEEDHDHCGKTCKHGTLSLVEAQTWADYISVFGNAVIAGDKLSCLKSERSVILKQSWEHKLTEFCIPLDLWEGDETHIPCCLLSSNGIEIFLSLFNWEDTSRQKRLRGFWDTEKLTKMHGHDILTPSEGVISVDIDAHGSAVFIYKGHRSFRELCHEIIVEVKEVPLRAVSITGNKFPLLDQSCLIPLGVAAQCPLTFDRLNSQGMLDGLFSAITAEKEFLGIPFSFTGHSRIIEVRSDNLPHKIEINVGKKLKVLYILHCCEYPVKGYLNSYLVNFRNNTEEIRIIVGEHIGNCRARYSLPWSGTSARIAWHDPQSDACLYMLKWESPYPDTYIESLEITRPEQRANIYLAGIAGT